MLPIYHLLTDPGFYFMIVVVVVATLVLKTRDEIGLRWRTLAFIFFTILMMFILDSGFESLADTVESLCEVHLEPPPQIFELVITLTAVGCGLLKRWGVLRVQWKMLILATSSALFADYAIAALVQFPPDWKQVLAELVKPNPVAGSIVFALGIAATILKQTGKLKLRWGAMNGVIALMAFFTLPLGYESAALVGEALAFMFLAMRVFSIIFGAALVLLIVVTAVLKHRGVIKLRWRTLSLLLASVVPFGLAYAAYRIDPELGLVAILLPSLPYLALVLLVTGIAAILRSRGIIHVKWRVLWLTAVFASLAGSDVALLAGAILLKQIPDPTIRGVALCIGALIVTGLVLRHSDVIAPGWTAMILVALCAVLANPTLVLMVFEPWIAPRTLSPEGDHSVGLISAASAAAALIVEAWFLRRALRFRDPRVERWLYWPLVLAAALFSNGPMLITVPFTDSRPKLEVLGTDDRDFANGHYQYSTSPDGTNQVLIACATSYYQCTLLARRAHDRLTVFRVRTVNFLNQSESGAPTVVWSRHSSRFHVTFNELDFGTYEIPSAYPAKPIFEVTPLQLIEERFQSDHNAAAYHEARANLFLDGQRWKDALDELTEAASIDHGNVQVWSDIGDCRERLKQFAPAVEAYGRAIELGKRSLEKPDLAKLYGDRAVARFKGNDPKGACIDYLKASSLGEYYGTNLWSPQSIADCDRIKEMGWTLVSRFYRHDDLY